MSDIRYAKYTVAADGMILKDGHTMFSVDIVKDLNRKSFLEKELSEVKEENDYLHKFTDITSIVENKKKLAIVEDLKRYKDNMEWLLDRCYLPNNNPGKGIYMVACEETIKFGGITGNLEADRVTLMEAIDKARNN